MRIAFLDCFAGISGDMLLGALVHAGVPPQVLSEATEALQLGASLRFETVDRSGISSLKVHVLEAGELAEGKGAGHAHAAGDGHGHSADGGQESGISPPVARQDVVEQAGPVERSQQPRTQHLHKTGHAHSHPHSHAYEGAEHAASGLATGDTASGPAAGDTAQGGLHQAGHVHGRSLSEIRRLITAAPLHEEVKRLALDAFDLLGHSEAKIHRVPVEEIHFHEVGAVDAIVDIVAASAGIHHLQIGAWFCSPVNVGGGMVECAHGTFPVPAPATADLLRGVPTYSAHVQKELVTPTGAALLRALNPTFGQQPPMVVEGIGYGAGTRNPEGFPNVLRLSFGEQAEAGQGAGVPLAAGEPRHGEAKRHAHGAEEVTVLETALDDLSPQVLAFVAEKALAEGALDVMLTPVIMKKGRPGTLLTVLCNPADSASLQQLLLRETSTLGIRIRQDRRACLERAHRTVETPYGAIRIKIGSQSGEERNAAPEFEDCRARALAHQVPLKQVQQAALQAYRQAVERA